MKIKQFSLFALGEFGSACIMNVFGLYLVFFFIPPDSENMPLFINQTTYFGLINWMVIIMFSQRLLDAITDIYIGYFSDKQRQKGRRRNILIKASIIPIICFSAGVFFPLKATISPINIIGLMVTLGLANFSFTCFRIPFLSLFTDIAKTTRERVNLGTMGGIANALGIIATAQLPWVWQGVQEMLNCSPIQARQWGILIWICMSALCLIPAIWIQENPEVSMSSTLSFRQTNLAKSLKTHLHNMKHFYIGILFYYIGVSIFITALPYVVTVLLRFNIQALGFIVPMTLLVTVLVVPFINRGAQKWGEKQMLAQAFILFFMVLILMVFLGKYPIAVEMQIMLFCCAAAFPLACTQLLINPITAKVIKSVERQWAGHEATLFACRDFIIKLGLSMGASLFIICAIYGKHIENDIGIRISLLLGSLTFLAAWACFRREGWGEGEA